MLSINITFYTLELPVIILCALGNALYIGFVNRGIYESKKKILLNLCVGFFAGILGGLLIMIPINNRLERASCVIDIYILSLLAVILLPIAITLSTFFGCTRNLFRQEVSGIPEDTIDYVRWSRTIRDDEKVDNEK